MPCFLILFYRFFMILKFLSLFFYKYCLKKIYQEVKEKFKVPITIYLGSEFSFNILRKFEMAQYFPEKILIDYFN